MNSEEYINQVNRLVDLQNVYLGIFLTILSILLAVFVFFQWRLSDKQIEKIKTDITTVYQKELDDAIKKNEENFLYLTVEIVFNAIDSMIHTELRIECLPGKIKKLLSLIENVEVIDQHQTNILFHSVAHVISYLYREETEPIFLEGQKIDYKLIYEELKYIANFNESKSDTNSLLKINYRTLKEEISLFEDKCNIDLFPK